MERHRQNILKANNSINEKKSEVAKNQWRPLYHVTSQACWINDPNGFIFYKGEYHLFYQHHPYSAKWGPMHWGHAKSKDLINWEHLPIAIAPSEDYDQKGCFSGSAIEIDEKLYIMYTGIPNEHFQTDLNQIQCMAVSEDALQFNKLEDNPVISTVPEGNVDPNNIRDPKVWKHGEYYYCLLGSQTKEGTGQVLLYRSENLKEWDFITITAKGEGNCGTVWECPDLFQLNDVDVLIFSPQSMKPEGDLYHNLHQAGYFLGQFNYDTGKLAHGDFKLLDYGFDYYAPQTIVDDQGRRIVIAWMAMWESEMPEQKYGWAGAMTIPRELKLRNGTLISQPVHELQSLRRNLVEDENIIVKGEHSIKGICGDCIELDVILRANSASHFGIKVRVNEETEEETVIACNTKESHIYFDRNKSGVGPGGVRKAPITIRDNEVRLQVYIDKSSVEVFINSGEKVMSGRIYPSDQARSIRFFANDNMEIVRIKKWDLETYFS